MRGLRFAEVFFFLFLFLVGCGTDYQSKVSMAQEVCVSHGQKFMTLGVGGDGVSFSAYCFQENPARWFRYEMP